MKTALATKAILTLAMIGWQSVSEYQRTPVERRGQVAPPPAVSVRVWLAPRGFPCKPCREESDYAETDTTREWHLSHRIKDAKPAIQKLYREGGFPLTEWYSPDGKWWYVQGWPGEDEFNRRFEKTMRGAK